MRAAHAAHAVAEQGHPPVLWRGVGNLPRRLAARRRDAQRFGLVVAAYYLAAHLGYAFEFSGPVAAIVWLPVGVGVAALYVWGVRLWPAVVVGDLLVNNYQSLPVGSAFAQSVGNVLEVVVAATLLRRLMPERRPLWSLRGVAGLVVAAVCGTAVSATVGVISLRLGHVVSAGDFGRVWRTWWLGDLCGVMIVVPLVLAWRELPPRPWKRDLLEGAVLLGAVTALSGLVFGLNSTRPLAYLVFPALVWAGLRFGPRGTSLILVVFAGVTLWGTTHHHGSFAADPIDRTIFESQLYLLVAAISALAVAAVASERRELAERVRASRARVVVAGEEERRRLERDLHDGVQQRLVALATHLRIAAERPDAGPDTARGALDRGADEAIAALDELRELAHGLHPRSLRTDGLALAVREVVDRSGLPVDVVELPRGRFGDVVDATAYFVVSEALANAAKHGDAAHVHVEVGQRGGILEVVVGDDGVGGAAESRGSGLKGLRDRVEALGGTFAVSSPAGGGTRVFAGIPIGADALPRRA